MSISESPQRLLFTIDEAAEALSISRASCYRLVRSGQLPSITLGRSRRVPLTALTQMIEASTTTALDMGAFS